MKIRNNLLPASNTSWGMLAVVFLVSVCPLYGRVVAAEQQPAASTTSPATGATSTLLFLGNQNIAPVVFIEDNAPAGVAVDITNALAPYLSKSIEIRAMDWSTAQKLVADGEADALIQINQTEERKKIYDFSDSLLESQFSIFTRTNRVDITGISSLHGLRVGVEKGGLPEQTLLTHSEIQLVIISDFLDGFTRLSDGALDAVVVDYRVGSYIAAKNNIRDIRATGEPVTFSYSAFAVKKGNTKLLNEINAALKTIKANGMYQAILTKWKPTETVFQTQDQITREILYAAVAALFVLLLVTAAWSVTINRELAKRKKAEEKLRSNEEELKKAQRLGRIGNWGWDMATDTIVWSDEYYRIFGFDPAQSPPNYEEHLKVYTPESAARLDAAVKKNIETGEPYELDLEIADPKEGAAHWITARSETVRDNTGKIIGLRGTAQDITERKLEAERLKELDKLKDDFLMVTTHELKSPLIPIKVQAQLLLAGDYGKINKEQEDAIEMIQRNEESLNTLASELLDISKIKSNKLELVLESADIGEVASEVVGDMKDAAMQRNLSLSLLPIPNMPEIRIDGSRVRQVIRNLLDNAIKFTPEQGSISVEVRKTDTEVAVSVKDSGIGIYKEDIPKLFLPFFRAESDVTRKYRGTGLGLAVSKGLVEAHGGTIWAESEGEGKGSTFTFTLPVTAVPGA